MARPTSRYVCQSCGSAFLRWEGQCRDCGAWNSLVETIVRETRRTSTARPATSGGTAPTALAELVDGDAPRRPTGIGELDRVLGGGLVDGSLVVLGGEPGIGKSTLVLQVAAAIAHPIAATGGHVLYASGEESAGQVRLRAGRLGLLDGPAGGAIRVVSETDIGRIVELATGSRPALLIIDSVQTVRVDELDGPPGSVGQVREAASRLQQLAKGEGLTVVVVGHVTKDGSLAGPKTLEHVVDVVLALEGERFGQLRLLRASKNRFGSAEEVGVFEMAVAGLTGVSDPTRAFLADREATAPGSVVAATIEGTRPILVEVQALVTSTTYGTPTRRSSGVDKDRLALLVAVLSRRAGVSLGNHDVYANIAGGLALEDPGLDLALAIALASSLRDRPVDRDLVAVGEVGLLGELRPVSRLDGRLREVARLGFRRALVPRSGIGPPGIPERLSVIEVTSVRDALGIALSEA